MLSFFPALSRYYWLSWSKWEAEHEREGSCPEKKIQKSALGPLSLFPNNKLCTQRERIYKAAHTLKKKKNLLFKKNNNYQAAVSQTPTGVHPSLGAIPVLKILQHSVETSERLHVRNRASLVLKHVDKFILKFIQKRTGPNIGRNKLFKE